MTKLIVIAVGTIGLIGSAIGIYDYVSRDTAEEARRVAEEVDKRMAARLDALLQQRLDARLRELGVSTPRAGDADEGLRQDLRGAAETLQAEGAEGAAAVERLIADGETDEARAILSRLAEADVKSGAQANARAAQRYRQIGALAFLDDTKAAMAAYAKATELDPDAPEGWNRLGALQLRTGALDAAAASFERVLSIGNRLADKTWEARATGNLGLIYMTRGELDRAEAMLGRALDLNEELGRKEGMAADYGNLGIIYAQRGEIDRAEAMHKRQLELAEELGIKEQQAAATGNLGSLYQKKGDTARACAHWRTARDLFRQIGSPTAAQVEGWMRDAGCPED